MPDSAGYLDQLQKLLPRGAAWTRNPDATLTKFLGAWADGLARVDARALQLVEEADPRTTLELLSDWEGFAGLPDPCTVEATTLQERRARLGAKLTTTGGQSRAYFIALAAALGYTITIDEYRPFMCGVARCGVTPLNGPASVRFYWKVHVPGPRVVWFRTGESAAGDSLGAIRRADDLECIFRRLMGSHTELIFAYEGA